MSRARAVSCLLAVTAFTGAAAFASATPADFDLPWHTISGGGGQSGGDGYELLGTVGRHDVPAEGAMAGGDFDLDGGFWTGAPCHGDLSGNALIDFDDLLRVLSTWGQPGGPEDLDGSGAVDFGDLLIVLAWWGPCR